MSLVNELDELNKAINSYTISTQGLSVSLSDFVDAYRNSNTLMNEITNDAKNSIDQLVRRSKEYGTIIERIKTGSISTREISNQIAASNARELKFKREIANLQTAQANALAANNTSRIAELKVAEMQLLRVIEGERAYNSSLRQALLLHKEINTSVLDSIPYVKDFVKFFKEANRVMLNAPQGERLKALFGFLVIKATQLSKIMAGAFIKAAFEANSQMAEMRRSLNMSAEDAEKLRLRYGEIANGSDHIAINSRRLVESQLMLSKQFGITARFSDEMVTTYSKLTKLVGLSEESAAGLAAQSKLSGMSLREAEENALGSAYGLQLAYGVELKQKDILEATGKVTGQVRSNLGANPEAIARAVAQAKLFGAELEDIIASSRSLLNFESSIENELKAELITGKQLNLERARALSLSGDQEGLARELSNQAGNFSEFSRLNVLQQQELADAFGMSADRLSDILFKQEFQNANAEKLRAIGKGDLADRLETISAQEKMNLVMENFNSMLSDVAVVLSPVVEMFANIAGFLSKSKALGLALLGITAGLAARSLMMAVANIFGASALAGPIIGIAAGVAGVAAMMAAVSKAQASAPRMAEGGIVTPRQGGRLVTVGEAGESEAIIPLSKMNNVVNNQQSAPIIIHNSFSNFKAASWDQLSNTQIRQASPTFV